MPNTETFTGTFAEIKKGAVIGAFIGNWTIEEECNVVEYQSSRTPGVGRAQPGGTKWRGSFTYELNATAVTPNLPQFQRGMEVADMEFHADDSGSNALTGDIVVATHSHENDVAGDAITGGTITFVGDGLLVRTGAFLTDEQLSSS